MVASEREWSLLAIIGVEATYKRMGAQLFAGAAPINLVNY